MEKKKVEAEMGPLGLLFDCPYCKQRIYIPTEDVGEEKQIEMVCDACEKIFLIEIKGGAK